MKSLKSKTPTFNLPYQRKFMLTKTHLLISVTGGFNNESYAWYQNGVRYSATRSRVRTVLASQDPNVRLLYREGGELKNAFVEKTKLSVSFGCQHFSPKNAARLRRWARGA